MASTSGNIVLIALAWALAVAVVLGAAATARWGAVTDGDDAHRFWGATTAIAVLWHADPGGSAGVHLLGAATACALFGLRLALVALALGTGLQHVADGAATHAWPVAYLAGAALPAAIAHAGLAWAVRGRERFGPVPWVAGAFAAGAASMAVSVALRAWLADGAGPSAAPDAASAAALLLAMAFAEAQLSAGVVAAVAAQRPHWLAALGRTRARPRR